MNSLYIPDQHLHAELIRITQEVNDLKDVDAVLDLVLYHARRLTNAVAGSIFLLEEQRLRFSYVQNDQLFSRQGVNRHVYSDFSLPVNEESIVGFAAHGGQTIRIEDAYQLPEGAPYSFNVSFDLKTGFRTRSVLAMPLRSLQGKVVGVLQLINARDHHNQIVPFSQERTDILPLFTTAATVAIERGVMTRELILRMMRMAELRDPTETGAHVQRVGAYSAVIYHQWALNKGVDEESWRRNKDLLRIAAMLHDVGKVGISDLILKKPDRLSEEEFRIMKWHTVFGARLFNHAEAPLDRMAGEIAMNHHEKWDGSGYPGRIEDLFALQPHLGEPVQGESIPLEARITALADVFDALCSKRSYKEPWSDDRILSLVRDQSGNHFDPEVVEAFFQVWDTVAAIRDHYGDRHPPQGETLEKKLE